MIEQTQNSLIEMTTHQMKKNLGITSSKSSGKDVIMHDIIHNIKKIASGSNLQTENLVEKSSIASLENIAACSASSSPTVLVPPNIDLFSRMESKSDASPLISLKSTKNLKRGTANIITTVGSESKCTSPTSFTNPVYSPSTIQNSKQVAENLKDGKILKLDPYTFLKLL